MLVKIATKHGSNGLVRFVTHKRFAVVFFLPSCCVNSLIVEWRRLPRFPAKMTLVPVLVVVSSQILIGSLSNYDADGNENSKKAIGLISKTSTLHVHHAFFVHFFAVIARLQRESAWIHVLSRTGTQDNNFLFFSWTLIQSFRIQLQKHLPTFDEVNEME